MNLKERLHQGEQVLGIMISMLCRPDVVRILQNSGYDFAIVDCEHGSYTTREVADIIDLGLAIDFPVLVRIPEMRREHALKFMEMGAAGLLLPNTESAEQAKMLVDCAKYAPMGHRGVSLTRPHTGFRKVDGVSYMAEANQKSLLLCQIESRAGVENAEAIAAVDGIDCLFIGPNDMTQDFGILNQFDHPETLAAFRHVIAAAEKFGKVSGVHFGGPEALKPWLSEGMRMNMCGSDVSLLTTGAKANFKALGR